MRQKRLLTAIITYLILIVISMPIFADIAPPLQPPGANPGPAEFVKTNVEMGVESVMITVGETSTLYYREPAFDTVDAQVTAVFAMNNPSDIEETLAVVFPLNDMEGWGDGDTSYPEIRNFHVSINDQQNNYVDFTTPNPHGSEKPEIKWAEFEVQFPPKEITFITVEYDLQSSGWFPEATFNYVLETGRGWHGPIGEAHIHLILPYEASADNVLMGENANTSTGGSFDGNQVHWAYLNLEPDAEDNWSATIIAPHIWKEILSLSADAEEGDGSAYKALTVIYDSLYIGHGPRPGTEGIVLRNHNAYQKAIAYDPDDDDVLARYADFLLTLKEMGIEIEEIPFMVEEVYSMASQALEINPNNKIAGRVIWALESPPYSNMPSPTATAINQPVLEIATAEPEITPDSTQAVKDQNDRSTLLAGGIVGVGLVVIFGLGYFLGRKSARK